MDDNRSYVIRTSRMSPHQKKAVERLAPIYCVPFDGAAAPVDPKTLFPTPAPVVLDIGFGMGRDLAEIAAAHPRTNFLGVEVHTPGVGKLLSEIERRGLENVRIVQADAVKVCGAMLAPGSVAALHLFFPDPWPKKRHHKRRLVRAGFPELVAGVLRPGGYLYMVTDWEDYALQMRTVLDETADFRNRYDAFAPRLPWRPTTAFEKKGIGKGHGIFELVYDRLPADIAHDTLIPQV